MLRRSATVALVPLALATALLAPSLAAAFGPAGFAAGPLAPSGSPSTGPAALASRVAFEPNLGQADAHARFVARAGAGFLFLADEEAVWALPTAPLAPPDRVAAAAAVPASELALVRMRFEGASPARIVAGERVAGASSYYHGDDPARWVESVPRHASVTYESLWPGVDLVFYGRGAEVEYDFVLAPGADASVIRFSFAGASPRIGAAGDLVLATPAGEVRHAAPVAFQERGGAREIVASAFAPLGGGAFGFRVGAFDAARPLVIDPLVKLAVEWSTLLGGALDDYAMDVALDAAGSPVVVGYTFSPSFPLTPGSGAHAGNADAFVARFDPSGTALLASALLGGPGNDYGWGVAVDALGGVVVQGTTSSPAFPTTLLAVQPVYGGGGSDAFVAKLAPGVGALLWSTFLGGAGVDSGWGEVAVDAFGAAYATGLTESVAFPTTPGAFQSTQQGLQDGFVTKIGPLGDALVWSTRLGGVGFQMTHAVAVDALGAAHVAGWTSSSTFPSTTGVPYGGGTWDAFYARFDATGALAAATLFGGAGYDVARGIALTSAGATIVGETYSSSFPTTAGAAQPAKPGAPGTQDAFAATLDATGAIVAATFLGGASPDHALDVAARADGSLAIVGHTSSSGFGGASPGWTLAGAAEAFLAVLDAQLASLESFEMLKGPAGEAAAGVAVDATGAIFVAGYTRSDGLATPGAFQSTRAGGYDAFLAKFDVPSGYSTFLGGAGGDGALAIEADLVGNAFVAGRTFSPSFPLTQANTALGAGEAFVTKLDATGALAYSTFFGGSAQDTPWSVAPDATGNALVVGETFSPDFPETLTSFAPGADPPPYAAFAAKLSPTGTLLWSRVEFSGRHWRVAVSGADVLVAGHEQPDLWGAGERAVLTKYDGAGALAFVAPVLDGLAWGVAPDGAGGAWVAGPGNMGDPYYAHVDATGAQDLEFQPSFPGSQEVQDVGIDAAGALYLVGMTTHDLATGAAAAGGSAAFVLAIAPGGVPSWSATLDGAGSEYAYGLDVGPDGTGFASGHTSSLDFPVSAGAFQSAREGVQDAFVASFTSTGLDRATFLGGPAAENAMEVAVGAASAALVAGWTTSDLYPTWNAFQVAHAGAGDAFVTRLDRV